MTLTRPNSRPPGQAHPGLSLWLVEGVSARLVDDARSGELDAALVGHPLTDRDRISLRELVNQPLVTMPAGTTFVQQTKKTFGTP